MKNCVWLPCHYDIWERMAETVRKTLNEKGYTYSNGTINCMQKDGDGGLGYVKYSIDFAPETAIQTKDAEVIGS